ncbi:MAG TPA: MltA domain-containing protein [Caulobacteraceae bacterium]|jgi:membrane-bound lytic murein transglycosylase A
MRRPGAPAAAALALLAAGCVTRSPPAPKALPLSALPGWAGEDHSQALTALKTACQVRARAISLPVAACSEPTEGAATSPSQARRFLEANFHAEPLPGEGLLTAYYAPVYPARMTRAPPFTAPVRPAPDLALFRGASPSRAEIEAAPAPGALAWMRPEDLFFLQIQGSGVLTLPDGRRLRAAFAAHNDRPFVGLAKIMLERGLLADEATSAEAIRAWLAAHRGPEADALMRENARYVFFQLAADDGGEPKGAAGVPLPPGRAIAVDRAQHGLGGLYWIAAEAPALSGARARYGRLAAALDTGGAILGMVRADLYLGTGEAAGREAGTVRHRLRMWRLVPVRR